MLIKGKVYLNIRRPSVDLVDELKKLGVATVHEAMFGINLMAPILRPLVSNMTIAGPAMTAVNHDGDNLAVHRVLALAKPGDILVLTTFGASDGGMWGELLSISARARGVAGVILNGGVRDIAAIRRLGFPVWYRTVSAQSTVKDNLGAVNVPTECGGVIVNPGDVIVADDDGVTVVPFDDLEEVVAKAKAREEKENKLRPRLEAGELLYDIMGFADKLREKGVEEISGSFPCERK